MDKLNASLGAIPSVSSVPVPRMPPGGSGQSIGRIMRARWDELPEGVFTVDIFDQVSSVAKKSI